MATASRNERSCETIRIVPVHCWKYCSSQTTAKEERDGMSVKKGRCSKVR